MPRKIEKQRPSQISEFKSVARSLDCDESEAAFDKALGKIGKAPQSKPEKKKRKSLKLAV